MTNLPRAPLNHEPEAVTWAREKAGLTRTALAEACGVSLALISMIESGQRSATPETLIKIARALNCPIVALERKREPETASPADDSVSELEVRGEERARQDTVPELRDTAVVRAER